MAQRPPALKMKKRMRRTGKMMRKLLGRGIRHQYSRPKNGRPMKGTVIKNWVQNERKLMKNA